MDTSTPGLPATAVGNDVIDYNIEQAVIERYEAGAQQPQPALCCPTDGYDSRYLEVLPEEIIQKDYGCGDPTRYIHEGEVVVDLGSGAGKNCYIMAQKVGARGRVIGVDFNDEMLALSRQYREAIAQKLGYQNVEFVKGKIQDLALGLDGIADWLKQHPITDMEQLAAYEAMCDRQRQTNPLIPTETVDAVVSNCVLNLVKPQQKKQLFEEIFRVLKRGGRAVISDIVCDEPPTDKILNDPDLWSGCIAGAFQEVEFLEMFEQAGFHGVEILARQSEPWQVIDGIEFRSLTVRAYKGKQGDCWERNQAVIYKGPWKAVVDDDGHTLARGDRMAVCDKTFKLYTDPTGPYSRDLIAVEPSEAIALEDAKPFACDTDTVRSAQATKGANYSETADETSGETGGETQAISQSCC